MHERFRHPFHLFLNWLELLNLVAHYLLRSAILVLLVSALKFSTSVKILASIFERGEFLLLH